MDMHTFLFWLRDNASGRTAPNSSTNTMVAPLLIAATCTRQMAHTRWHMSDGTRQMVHVRWST